jgi:hypothetical protein
LSLPCIIEQPAPGECLRRHGGGGRAANFGLDIQLSSQVNHDYSIPNGSPEVKGLSYFFLFSEILNFLFDLFDFIGYIILREINVILIQGKPNGRKH